MLAIEYESGNDASYYATCAAIGCDTNGTNCDPTKIQPSIIKHIETQPPWTIQHYIFLTGQNSDGTRGITSYGTACMQAPNSKAPSISLYLNYITL